jgi:hypothetical protein
MTKHLFSAVLTASMATAMAIPSFAADAKTAKIEKASKPAVEASVAEATPSSGRKVDLKDHRKHHFKPHSRHHSKHSAHHAMAPGKMHRRSPERFVQRLEKDLQLTPEQVAKVREILVPARAAAGAPSKKGETVDKAKSQDKRMARRGALPHGSAFAAQMRSEKVDVAALDREWEGRMARQRAGFERMRDKFVALHAVLTPEQRAKLADRMERRGARVPGARDKDVPQDKRG